MVCSNCHSDQVIAVQDQHFCINCGQMVSETPPPGRKSRVGVQANGLPEGVKILPVDPPEPSSPEPAATPAKITAPGQLIHTRPRLDSTPPDPDAPKRRKRGRPKSGRLDVPRATEATVPVTLPSAPKLITKPAPVASPAVANSGPRRMSDLAPRRAPTPENAATVHTEPAESTPRAKTTAHPAPVVANTTRRSRSHVHKVGIPPLHYAPIIAFSLRARVRVRLVLLAALGAVSLGLASAYGVWLLLSGGMTTMADRLITSGPKLLAEILLLAIIYYIGRSLGQTAITYGIAREADQRPVTLSRQLGIAINTFGRRLQLDIGYGLLELGLLAAAAALFFTGGETWPMQLNLQIGLVFCTYLAILYLLSALALSRGLAGVNLTLTTHRPTTAAKLGWQLFSHRIELIGPRFGALLIELVLAIPLVALAVAFVASAPANLHLLVAIGVGLLAWLAGALFGVGTAAWWAMLYRQLVLIDRPGSVVALLSSRQPEDARRGPLMLVVALSTLILAATLVLPWLNLD